MECFWFKGTQKKFLIVTSVERPSWASIKRNILNVPGLPGGYLQETTTDPRPIRVNVLFRNEGDINLQRVKEELAEWLVTSQEEELIVPDESDRVYYAAVEGSFDPEEIVTVGRGTITFICPDPYKYGPEKKVEFVDTKNIYVDGTVETDPVITVEIKQDTTFVAVSDGEKINLIGRQAEVTQQPIVREERKFWHEMGALTGWSDTTTVEEGVITGTMKTTGYSFYTDDYGANAGWHGPAKKISLGSSIQDFQVDALVHQSSTSGKTGSIEIALLDANNTIVAKMLMSKRSANNVANWARIRAGTVANGHDIMNSRGATDKTWANFDGMLRISRVGNVWTAYACLIDVNGVQHTRLGATWVDSTNIAAAQIAQIQVQLWQYGTVPTTQQYIADLKAYKINSPTDSQVPIIVKAGDIIEFDHQADIIRRNGEDITREKAFIGEYFPLKMGFNTVIVEPAEAVSKTEVRWKPKWL